MQLVSKESNSPKIFICDQSFLMITQDNLMIIFRILSGSLF